MGEEISFLFTFLQFVHKMNHTHGCHGCQIWLSVINIVEMGEGDTWSLISPIKLAQYVVAMASILAEY